MFQFSESQSELQLDKRSYTIQCSTVKWSKKQPLTNTTISITQLQFTKKKVTTTAHTRQLKIENTMIYKQQIQ